MLGDQNLYLSGQLHIALMRICLVIFSNHQHSDAGFCGYRTSLVTPGYPPWHQSHDLHQQHQSVVVILGGRDVSGHRATGRCLHGGGRSQREEDQEKAWQEKVGWERSVTLPLFNSNS